MTETMIILQNSSSTGKTSTLLELAKILEQNGASLRFLDGNLLGGDFIVEITYNGQTIIIISMGDNAKLQDLYNKVFVNNNKIDIIFGACRTKGITVKITSSISKSKQFDIIWTSTYKNKNNANKLNKIRATELFNLL